MTALQQAKAHAAQFETDRNSLEVRAAQMYALIAIADALQRLERPDPRTMTANSQHDEVDEYRVAQDFDEQLGEVSKGPDYDALPEAWECDHIDTGEQHEPMTQTQDSRDSAGFPRP